MRFVINYNTGVKHIVDACDIDDVKALAVKAIEHTQEHVTIENEFGERLSIARWYGVGPDIEDDDELILLTIGNGFYAEWDDVVY